MVWRANKYRNVSSQRSPDTRGSVEGARDPRARASLRDIEKRSRDTHNETKPSEPGGGIESSYKDKEERGLQEDEGWGFIRRKGTIARSVFSFPSTLLPPEMFTPDGIRGRWIAVGWPFFLYTSSPYVLTVG